MFKYYDALLNRSGDALVGHFVRLYDSGGSQVEIFADDSETPIITESGIANAAKSDDNGMVRFYVPSGEYDIRLYDASDTFLASERAVPMVKGVSESTLAEPSAAADIGEANEGNVQAAIDAATSAIGDRPTTAALASSSGGGMMGYTYNAPYLSGTVGNKLASSITLRELGVYGDGTNEAVAWQGAIDAVAGDSYFDGRHITLIGDPHAAYYFTSDIHITRPHFTIDLMGAFVMTNWRFIFEGNPDGLDGAMEDDDLLLDDVHFRNAQFGNPADQTLPTRGPMFQWVRNSSMKNVTRLSRGGTPFNLHFAKNCLFQNVAAKDARAIGEGGAIGILLLHTHGCTVQDFEITGPGEWVYCVQQKGGFANRWINGYIHDVPYANPTGALFRERGDSPYQASTTTGPYPYSTGAWSDPDTMRASHDTQWTNLTAKNTTDTMPSFLTQESKASKVRGLTVINGRGVGMNRLTAAPAGYDDGHQIDGFRGVDVVLPFAADATGADPMESLRVSDFRVSSMIDTALATQRAIYLLNIKNPIFRGVEINSAGASVDAAIRHVAVEGAEYDNLTIEGAYTGQVISEDTATTGSRIRGNMARATGSTANKFSGGKAQVLRDIVASAFQTTDATANNLTRTAPATNSTQYLTVTVIAKAVGSDDFAKLKVGRFFKDASGTVTALGASADTIENIRVGAASWTVALGVTSNIVRITCTGAAATTINWEVSYEWR